MAGVIAERLEGPGLVARVGHWFLRYSLIIGLFVLWDVLVRTGAYTPFMLTVHPTMPVATVKEFISYAKSKPDQLNVSTTGTRNAAKKARSRFRPAPSITAMNGSPIATPISKRRRSGSVMACRSGEPGYSRSVANRHAEIMKQPSSAPSMA